MKRRILQWALTTLATLAICGATAAAASAAATATTEPASNVTATSAILRGVIHTNDNNVTVWQFEYGRTSGYGTFTPAHTIVGPGGNADVSAAISGLRPGTRYHFQLVALNSSGPNYTLSPSSGGDATFSTRPLGRLRLRKASLVVKPNRRLFLSLTCARNGPATARCVGQLAITTTVRSGGRFVRFYCGGAPFAIQPGHTKRIKVVVSPPCMGVLRGTPSHRISGTLSASMYGHVRLRKRVTLILG
jgi:hypothetical protein